MRPTSCRGDLHALVFPCSVWPVGGGEEGLEVLPSESCVSESWEESLVNTLQAVTLTTYSLQTMATFEATCWQKFHIRVFKQNNDQLHNFNFVSTENVAATPKLFWSQKYNPESQSERIIAVKTQSGKETVQTEELNKPNVQVKWKRHCWINYFEFSLSLMSEVNNTSLATDMNFQGSLEEHCFFILRIFSCSEWKMKRVPLQNLWKRNFAVDDRQKETFRSYHARTPFLHKLPFRNIRLHQNCWSS